MLIIVMIWLRIGIFFFKGGLLSYTEAKATLLQCVRLAYLRDCRSWPKYHLANIDGGYIYCSGGLLNCLGYFKFQLLCNGKDSVGQNRPQLWFLNFALNLSLYSFKIGQNFTNYYTLTANALSLNLLNI